jgi:pimeloyl-ACP methyl ester carboxylesterase
MDTALVGNEILEYSSVGSGEPVLLVHGSMISDSFEPIIRPLSSDHQVITYRRRGFGQSSPVRSGGTVGDEAADAVGLLDHLGIGSAHVVGHSFGAVIALQVAVNAPERVHSLGLLEAGLNVESGAEFAPKVPPIVEAFQSGDIEGALLGFMTAVFGANPVERISAHLGEGWYPQAVVDFPTHFAGDVPARGSWEFTESQARTITQPALTVAGTDTLAMFADSYTLLNQWLPNAEPFELAGASHLCPLDAPEVVATALGEFLSRHPIAS